MEVITAKNLPMEDTYIYPVGDVQLGAPGFHKSTFQRYIAEGMERNAWFIGMGDYVDVASPSNRKRWHDAEPYDNFRMMVEDAAQRHEEEFFELVKGTESRWLGLHEGHHFFDFEDGTTTDIRLAKRLKAPFIGTVAYTILSFKRSTNASRRFVIWSTHGYGGGGKMAASINKLENLLVGQEGVDLFLIGHYHRQVMAKAARIRPTGKPPYHITHRNVMLVTTGGFLRGYLEGSRQYGRAQGDYVEKALMNPVALGGSPVKIEFVWRDGDYIPEPRPA